MSRVLGKKKVPGQVISPTRETRGRSFPRRGIIQKLEQTRARVIVLFAILLLASSAVPVFAADEGEQAIEEAQIQALGESSAVAPPNEDQVREGLEAAEGERAARQHELESFAQAAQREESRYAFADLSASEARELLLSSFQEQLAVLNADPARVLSDVEVLRTYGESAATIRDEGDGSLLEAGIPIRTENAEGDLEKVDLTVQPTMSGFEPANPLVDLRIPDSAGEVIDIGEEGLGISSVGADEESSAQILEDKNVWFSNVQTDTDLLISPIAGGLELFDQLRSADSPETLRFQLDLPEGAHLRANGAGGAEISNQGKVTAVVSPPTAVDAQGTVVPVQLEVEGTAIALRVPHRQGDFAYPILVDPAIREEAENAWYFGHSLEALSPGIWWYSTNDPTELYHLQSYYCLNSALCSPSGRGLFISMLNRNIPANIYVQWYYSVPGATTYIPSIYPEYSAYLNPFWRTNNNCNVNTYSQPHDYNGAYDASGNWVWLETNRAQWYGNAAIFTKAKGIAFGMSSGGGTNIPCWRDIMLGGTVVRLDDPEKPTLSSVTGVPSGWISDATPFTVTANVQDPGLGVQNVTMTPAGRPTVLHIPAQNQCPGTKVNPCPATRAAQFKVNGDLFDEGEKTVSFSAYDPTGKVSSTYQTTARVDRTAPEVVLGGQLAVATKETEGDAKDPEKWDELRFPVYNLDIKATDGTLMKTSADRRSGVKSIEVYLDDKSTPEKSWTQPCSTSSCEMTQTYALKLNELSADVHHTLRVKVKDQVNRERLREIEFEYIPATGMKNEYALHYFPLPDGQGDESQEEHPDRPELAVNVMNGNLVYREQDVEIEGPAVDLEVERYYNSFLPASEDTEWGEGWTLAQTPGLEPIDTGGTPAPDEAELLEASGAIEEGVQLPVEAGGEQFDPGLHATLTKKPSGGFVLTDETGESSTSVAFDEGGQTEALLTEGYAKVDYDYEGGDLAEIAIQDPASSDATSPRPPDLWSQYGSVGSGDGQLNLPVGLAADAKGNIWVADTFNNRIQKFSPGGEYLSQLGTPGSGNGQLNRPYGLALDSAGNLWVADTANNRIQKFGPGGEYLSQFGAAGSGNGQFNQPTRIAIDSAGNLWVADSENHRIQKFSPSGEYLSQLGSKGSGDGQLDYPGAIAFDSFGNLLIADKNNHRIQKFGPNGEYLTHFGTQGSGEGQLNTPTALAVDAEGNLWIADSGNHRVQKLSPSGEYLTEFGSKGSGGGQFKTPYGLALDPAGNIWVADTYNNRIQARRAPSRWSQYGSAGSGDGQFNIPLGVEADSQGNIWVADTYHHRIQKFGPSGEYLSHFGSKGSGSGQLSQPYDVAVDSAGNIWVVDTGNDRIQKFSASGAYLTQFGTKGSGNGQFTSPTRITITAKGILWVTDSGNNRIQKFAPDGGYLGQVGSAGSGNGQFNYPAGVAVGPKGNFWVADRSNNRIQAFSWSGEYLGQFGKPGTGNGELNAPTALTLATDGTLWVADSANNRLQAFSPDGEYLAKLGTKGSSPGQFKGPYGVAIDPAGNIWVADASNNRLHRWTAPVSPGLEEEAELTLEDDPSIEVSVSAEDLVQSLAGDETGAHSYTHVGDDLTAHSGPAGEIKYQYGSQGMTRVTLANGTYASITYDAIYGRVASVTVDPAGSEPANTTYFEYSDQPRRTTVVGDAPSVTYDFGADGSVLKWWNTPQPPDLDDISGSFYFNKETAAPVSTGLHNLLAQAHSEEGIASIQFIANGNQLVDEMTCEQDPGKAGLECLTVINEWVIETAALPPGFLQLEVITTDRLGATDSERFWVNIPYTPPEPPGAVTPPKFLDILRFREEHGLELVFPVANELELNDRIFDLIGAWHNPQTAAGEVARASMGRWAAPLRSADVAELEWRSRYWRQASAAIPAWVSANASSTFAGVYIDERAGGLIRLGFTGEQATQTLTALKQNAGLIAQPARVTGFTTPPQHTLAALEGLEAQVGAAVAKDYPAGLITNVNLDIRSNSVEIGASSVSQAKSILQADFGAQAPFTVSYQPNRRELKIGRERIGGMVRAGDEILHRYPGGSEVGPCTAAFGAFEKAKKPATGEPVLRFFALSAGHCAEIGETVRRRSNPNPTEAEKQEIGEVRRSGYETLGDPAVDVDANAIRLNSPAFAPRQIFQAEGMPLIDVTSIWTPTVGTNLCFSGRTSKNLVRCGPVLRPAKVESWGDGSDVLEMCFEEYIWGGDSGSPVWVEGTGVAVGIAISGFGGPDEPGLSSKEKEEEESAPKEACATLLQPYPNRPPAASVFGSPDLAPLHLVTHINAGS